MKKVIITFLIIFLSINELVAAELRNRSLKDKKKSGTLYSNLLSRDLAFNVIGYSMPKDDIDWLKKLADSIIARWPNPSVFVWDWGEAVMMNGMWKAYRVTDDLVYFNYIKAYIDHYVDDNGNILPDYEVIDYVNKIAPGMLLPLLYTNTLNIKYLTAANTLVDYLFNNAPRIDGGAFSGGLVEDKVIGLDTLYMLCVFLVRMGWLTGQTIYYDEAVNQVILHSEKLKDEDEKLFYHGWDENGSRYWADPVTHLSPCFWARGNGWVLLTILEMLEYLPYDYYQRSNLINIFNEAVVEIAEIQDENTGLWYTVLKEESRAGNYVETSASAMFVYSIQKGIMHGYIDDSYQVYVDKGNDGLNTKIYNDNNNLAVVTGISRGTAIGDYNHYVGISCRNNLTWGLGAFLMAKTLFRPNRFPPSRILTIDIDSLNNRIFLNWNSVNENTGGYPINVDNYILTRAFDCSFNNSIDSIISVADTCYLDTCSNFLSNPNDNCFYNVIAVDPIGLLSENSDIIGEFDFELVTTPGTDFNEIALPLNLSGVSNADELMQMIPCCNSIARWNASQQGYEQYFVGIPPTNFAVQMGYPYYVNVTTDTIFTLLGKIAQPTFSLITTPTTDFNEVVLTLDKTDITKASELMADIPNCNSVARWNASQQGYEQYFTGIPPTDFNVRPGYPYYVNVTADVTWPQGGVPKREETIQEFASDSRSKAPHMVWGMIPDQWAGTPEDKLDFLAFIMDRPEEVLSRNSPGCMIQDGYWVVQCGNFLSPWKAGELLKVIIKNNEKDSISEVEIALTYNPADSVQNVNIENYEHFPVNYELKQNFPNPFNPRTTIRYQTSKSGKVRIVVYDIVGKEIKTLINEIKEPGYHEIMWDGSDGNHHIVASGMYIVRLETDDFVKSTKLLFIR